MQPLGGGDTGTLPRKKMSETIGEGRKGVVLSIVVVSTTRHEHNKFFFRLVRTMSAIVTYSLGKLNESQEISGIRFGILKAEEVRRMAVVELDETSIYHRGAPTPRGVLDHRMGTVDRRLTCGHCGLDVRSCSGHFGKIELPMPVFHTSFLETVRKVLNCVCFSCSGRRLTDNECMDYKLEESMSAVQRKARLSHIYTTCRFRKTCPHCSSPCPLVIKHNNVLLKADWSHIEDSQFTSAEERRYMTSTLNAATAQSILSNIANSTIEWFGFDPDNNHPKEMVLTVLIVPPPVLRPSVMVTEGSRARGQDDLTIKLVEIIKKKQQLLKAFGKVPTRQDLEQLEDPVVLDLWERLTQDVGVYFHNNPRLSKVSTQRSGVPTKCLFGRLKGKQGRFRLNLQGKRVNFSGRTVISPDPVMDVDEVGIPESMATQLTIQEMVTKGNIDSLVERVHRGSGHVLGAESIITPDGTNIQLEFCQNRDKLLLQEGWVVERPLQDGDYVIFNRQPSLHRCSMMGHRVVVMKHDTFRVNLAVVGPYNADFDGDEMNVHVPQSPLAITEVQGLMSVPQQFVSPQASQPVIGLVQDALLGGYLMTSIDTIIDRSTFMSVVAAARRPGCDLDTKTSLPPPTFLHPVPLWTGKQLLEVVLPPITMGNPKELSLLWAAVHDDGSMMQISTHPVVVRRGRILTGQLNKSTLGISPNSVMHHCLLALGCKVAIQAMGDLQRIINRWLLERGFSIGIGDCVPSHDVDCKMREGIRTVMDRVDTLQSEIPRWSSVTRAGNHGEADKGLEEIAAESTIHRMVNKVQMSTGSLVRREMGTTNGLGSMVTAGSKGNAINICQIMLCVGQNCVNGARITPNGEDDRTLPAYPRGDRSMDGMGFVSNSYILGLNARETFLHAKGGREGLVDTAVKTSKTGYLQRRMVKAMESHRVEHDLSVRDANNNIVEFIYGGDGINPIKLERMHIRAFVLGDEELVAKCVTQTANIELERLQRAECAAIVQIRDEVRGHRIHFMNPTIDTCVTGPVDPHRVLRLIVCSTKGKCEGADSVQHQRVAEDVTALLTGLQQQVSLPLAATANLRLAIALELRTAVVVERLAATKQEWTLTLQAIQEKVLHAIAEAGEMVGCIAAQSIGEPATQLTLNSFHLSGVAQNGVGQLSGIPRIAEIVDATKVIKTASMLLPFVDATRPRDELEIYARSLELCTLEKLVTSYEMEVIAPDTLSSQHPQDAFALAMDSLCDKPCDNPSRACMRLVLNRRLLRRRGIVPSDIAAVLDAAADLNLKVVASPESATDWVLRVWVQGVETDNQAASLFAKLMPVVVGGKAKIELAELRLMPRVVVSPTRTLVVQDEFMIETAGADLAEMMWEPHIAWERVTTNSIMDVFEVLGISAARILIFHELRKLISGDTNKVNDRHLMMVANTMTQNGVIMSLSRHGINRIAKTGPLLRSSFEETSEVLTDAGVFGESDTVQGVSQSIMLGRLPFVGTGCSELLMAAKPGEASTTEFKTPGATAKLDYCRRIGQSRFRGHTQQQTQHLRCHREDVDALFATEKEDTLLKRHLDAGMSYQDTQWSANWGNQTNATPVANLHDVFGDLFPETLADTDFDQTAATHIDDDTDTIRNQELIDVVSRMPYNVPASPGKRTE